ncbi:RNA polymerase sigma factor [Cytobacillus gottheilii]|uniref:RNA polymerase sigma factor n=1 Tax=Cytobacillus gottheilii TaxID=859144 RepID=UPI0009BBB950|nr:sigma-70 family RNA polymerase sigma factor [Cytobacillus gottheilii]
MEARKDEIILNWYDQYYDDLYRFIFYMLGDQQQCEDIVHDTFVEAFKAFERFENRSSVKTWLFGIAKNLVIDEIRKRKRRKLHSLLIDNKELRGVSSVENEVELKMEMAQILNYIQALKPNYRIVIVLGRLQECSAKEMAELLGWSETKVRKTLSRALKAVRKHYEKEGGNSFEQENE